MLLSMKIRLFVLIVVIFMFSCNVCIEKKHSFIPDSSIDTIEYIIPIIKSTEGNRTIVYYTNNIIDSSITYIYGEMGQIKIQYYFLCDFIQVVETQCFYNEILTSYNDSLYVNDSILLTYKMDYEGNVINANSSNITNIFKEYKMFIPFKINKHL